MDTLFFEKIIQDLSIVYEIRIIDTDIFPQIDLEEIFLNKVFKENSFLEVVDRTYLLTNELYSDKRVVICLIRVDQSNYYFRLFFPRFHNDSTFLHPPIIVNRPQVVT